MSGAFPSYESRTVSLSGTSIHYLVGGQGPPLLLVHGLGSSAGVEFYFNLEALAREHTVYGLDLPGFGKSEKPRLEYSIPFFLDVVHSFMGSQGLDQAAVMGVSLGGRVALGFALEFPAAVSRLVLVDALGLGLPRRVMAYTVLLARGFGEVALSGTAAALRRMNPALVRRLWGIYLARPGKVAHILTDERIADHMELLSTPAYRAAYLSALRSIAGVRRLRTGITVNERLASLTAPTLLIWGGHDNIFPVANAQAASLLIRDARLVVFEDSGHTPQMEEPARFNRVVLEFLRNA
jgi:pimeloyl-ACP methyl ester carboxylesterase